MKNTDKTTKELKVLLQGDDWTFTRKFACAEDFNLSKEDPPIDEYFRKANSYLTVTPEREEFHCKIVKR